MSLLPFDPIGTLQSNRRQNEIHTVTAINGVDHNYFIPDWAPFYAESVVVFDRTTAEPLTENVDYVFGYEFKDASTKVGKSIYGAIILTDPQRTGSFSLRYQSLGGDYVDETTLAIENGVAALQSLVYRDWSEIVNLPAVFPPTPHMTRLDEVVGVAEIIAQLQEMVIAIANRPVKVTAADIVDLEPSYTQPLLATIAGIAEAVSELNERSVYYWLETNTVLNAVTFESVMPDTWLNIGEVLAPAVEGTYKVDISGRPKATANGQPVATRLRFTVNGQPLPQSGLASTLVGLAPGDEVRLQVATEAMADQLDVGGTRNGCGLTLLRVSV